MLATVAVKRRELGTLRMIAPPMMRPIIWMASPTDFNWVVMVVLKPISRIMTVENELTTPLGMAAAKTEVNINSVLGSVKPRATWLLSKALFLIPESLEATRLTAIRRSRWLRNLAFEGESGRKNHMTKAQRQVVPPSCKECLLVSWVQFGGASGKGKTYNVEDELPAFGLHVDGKLRDTHGDVGANLIDHSLAWKSETWLMQLTMPPQPRDEYQIH